MASDMERREWEREDLSFLRKQASRKSDQIQVFRLSGFRLRAF